MKNERFKTPGFLQPRLGGGQEAAVSRAPPPSHPAVIRAGRQHAPGLAGPARKAGLPVKDGVTKGSGQRLPP